MKRILFIFFVVVIIFPVIVKSEKLCVFFSKKEIDIPLFNSTISSICYDNKKRIWIGSEKNLIIRKAINLDYEYETEKYIEFPINNVTNIKEDYTGYVWTSTKNGIYADLIIKKKKFDTSNTPLPDNNITSIVVDLKNRKWFSTSRGIVLFNDSNWTIFNKSNTDFPSDSIIDLVIDKNDILWAVTTLCLIKFDGSDWDFFNDDDCNMISEATCISVDSTGKIYIGTKKGLITFFEANWKCYNKDNSKLPDNWITTISVDKNNWIYIGTKKGLGILEGNDWFEIEEYNFNNLNNEIYFLRNRSICDPYYTELTVCTKDGIFYYTFENCQYSKCFELIYDVINNHDYFLSLCDKMELVTPSYCTFRSKYMDLAGFWIFAIKYFRPEYHVVFDKKICFTSKQEGKILKHHIKLLGSNNKKLFIDFAFVNGKWLLDHFSDHNSVMSGNEEADE